MFYLFYLSDNVVPISTSESEQQVTSVADERTGERQFGPKPPISRPPPGGGPPPRGGVCTSLHPPKRTPQNPRRISPSAFLEPKVKDPKSRFWHSPHLCVGGVQSGDAFFCLNFGPKTPLFKLLYLVLGVDVIPGGVFRGGGAPPPGGGPPPPKTCLAVQKRGGGQVLELF